MRQGSRRLITGFVLLLAAFFIISIGTRSGMLQPITSVLMIPFRPIAHALTDLTGGAINLTGEQPEMVELEESNRELEALVAELQVEIIRLREIEQDYFRLSDIADYVASRPDQNLVTADVIALDTSGYLRWIMINRGTRDGINVGNPVVTGAGLVGRIENAAANTAWVRLTIDQNSAVNAHLQTARAEGTVIGQLRGGLRMEYIPQSAVVEPGDMVLTSGLGGTFPANIVIGQVTSVRRPQADPFQTAEIRPMINFEDLRIVSVITSFQPLDTSIFDEDLLEETP